MKLITKRTDYAIAALLALADAGEDGLSAGELASHLGIPHPVLRQVLPKLAAGRMVTSQPGRAGGYRLARELGGISVRDVVELFEGPVTLLNCSVGDTTCRRVTNCVLRRRLAALESQLASDLAGITISALAPTSTRIR